MQVDIFDGYAVFGIRNDTESEDTSSDSLPLGNEGGLS